MTKRGRNALLIVDTAVVALSNAIVLIMGARTLPAGDLTQLTLFQLFAAISTGVYRSTILSPALAVRGQRGTDLSVPQRWSRSIAVPVGLAAGSVSLVGLRPGSHPVLLFVIVVVGATPLALVQDHLRFSLLSRNDAFGTLLSDGTWLMVTGAGLAASLTSDSWLAFGAAWAGGALAGIATSAWRLRRPSVTVLDVTLGETLALGRWSGLDSSLSGIAALVPILVSTYALTSADASVYRILQNALGPLNVLSTAFLTIFGLDAARYADLSVVSATLRRTVRQSVLIAMVAVALLGVGVPALMVASGLSISAHLGPVLVTIYAGALGAATMPFASVAAAMGGQRYGLYLRVGVLTSSIAIGAFAAVGSVGMGFDPIGAVTIVASTVNLVGWSMATRRLCRLRLKGPASVEDVSAMAS